jgi:hypothetical protein
MSTQASPDHAGLHTASNVAVIAVETKLGTGASTPTNNNFLVGTGTGTSAWTKASPTGVVVGTTDSQTLTNKTLTSPTINTAIISNPTLSVDSVAGYTVSNTGSIYGISVTTGQISSALALTSSLAISTTLTVTGASTLTGQLTVQSGTAPPAAGVATAGIKMSSTANLGLFFGAGAPTFSAAQGAVYMNTTGSSTSTRLYINTTGSTTWTSVTTAA